MGRYQDFLLSHSFLKKNNILDLPGNVLLLLHLYQIRHSIWPSNK